jgi:predicted ATPase/DNA-binding SARP family transcriptional activator
VELRLLGGVEIVGPEGPVPISPAARVLLAGLLVSRRSTVSLDHLAHVLWGDGPPPTARPTLQTHLSKLRTALRAVPASGIELRAPGYVLAVERSCVDADRFEDALDDARRLRTTSPSAALHAYADALACWSGDALAGHADEPWARPEAVRLDELRLVADEERVDLLLAIGHHAEAVAHLEGVVAAHPLRERPHTQLMLALHRSGRQAEALRVAHALRRHLADELGLQPSEALRALEQAVAVDDPSLGTPSSGHRPSSANDGADPVPASSAVPLAATPLVGRDAELADLSQLARGSGLLTLVGPGGVGKSALAFEVARSAAGERADGICLVELAAVGDDAGVEAATAAALHVEQRPGRSLEESVVERLAPLEVLLLVDNCEHVLGAAGRLISRIVRWCPQVRVLATSRAPLGLAAEVVLPVAPLPVPADPAAPLVDLAANPSVVVFVGRATRAAPGFVLDERSGPAVAELCVALDGVPLALELAAARMRSMSAPELRDRLHERFSLLDQGPAAEARHRTLLDLVQWSYELLTPGQQQLLAELSTFSGGFDLAAAEETCSVTGRDRTAVLPLLAGLVEHSLVAADADGASVRYRQLETIRQFGADRLDERPDGAAVRAAHRATFTALAEEVESRLDGPDEGSASARLDREWPNLRAAVRSAVADDDADLGLRLVVAAREVSFRHMRYELVRWAEELIELPSAQGHPLLPTALAVTAYGHFVRGELRQAVDRAERALGARVRLDRPADGLAERVLANALFYQGDREAGQAWMDRMVEAAEAQAHDGRLTHALYMRSVALTSIGDAEVGAELARRSLTVARRTESPTALSQAAYAAGLATAVRSRATDEAVRLLEEAAALAASAGNRWMEAFAMTEAMWLRGRSGDTATALAGFRRVVETWFQRGDWANQWLSLRLLAGILASVGRDGDAALLFGAVLAAGASTALPFAPTDAAELQEVGVLMEERLGIEAAAQRRRGGMMRDEEVVATALAAIDAAL